MADESNYLSRLQAALPPGRAWTRHPQAELTKVLRALAAEYARCDAVAQKELLDESLPETSEQRIELWEELTKPYYDGVAAPASLQMRRAAVIRKLAFRGDASLAGLSAIAADTGVSATFTTWKHVHRVGDRCGSRIYNWPWLSAILVEYVSVDAETDLIFEAAISQRVQAHVVHAFVAT